MNGRGEERNSSLHTHLFWEGASHPSFSFPPSLTGILRGLLTSHPPPLPAYGSTLGLHLEHCFTLQHNIWSLASKKEGRRHLPKQGPCPPDNSLHLWPEAPAPSLPRREVSGRLPERNRHGPSWEEAHILSETYSHFGWWTDDSRSAFRGHAMFPVC